MKQARSGSIRSQMPGVRQQVPAQFPQHISTQAIESALPTSSNIASEIDTDKLKLALMISAVLSKDQLEQLTKKFTGDITDAHYAYAIKILGKPIRTVLYIDVTGMQAADARVAVQSLMAAMPVGHPHYVVTVRNGRPVTDVQFENEFLNVAKSLCEVKDGEIVLRGGYAEVEVVRQKIS